VENLERKLASSTIKDVMIRNPINPSAYPNVLPLVKLVEMAMVDPH
jgi:hypothetical protein